MENGDSINTNVFNLLTPDGIAPLVRKQSTFVLVEEVYKTPSDLPKEEIYGLTNQMRRVAVLIPLGNSEMASRGIKRNL